MTSAEIVGNILSHHGIKGMKWGVRRKATVGGGVQMHPDATRARTTHKTLKTHGSHALSTQDLQHYANRLSVEQNVSRLQSNQKNAGAKFVTKTLGRVGNRVLDKIVDKSLDASFKVVLSR
jgi:membrane protease subunit (stomatin/prohibitin family)